MISLVTGRRWQKCEEGPPVPSWGWAGCLLCSLCKNICWLPTYWKTVCKESRACILWILVLTCGPNHSSGPHGRHDVNLKKSVRAWRQGGKWKDKRKKEKSEESKEEGGNKETALRIIYLFSCQCIQMFSFLTGFSRNRVLECPLAILLKKHPSFVPLAQLIASSPILSCIHYEYTYLRANSGTRTHISFFPQKRRKTVVQCSTLCRLQGRILNV